MSALAELKKTLETRYGATLPVAYRAAGEAVRTGVDALDALLPWGGLPRGRLTAWVPGGGATALLLASCRSAVSQGERAAWIDVEHRLSADFWTDGPLLVRPEREVAGLACAELLLRSGGFALVVVGGAADRSAAEGVRLTRAARAGGGALVLVTRAAPVAQLRVRTRLTVDGFAWQRDPFGDPVVASTVRVELEAKAPGWSGRTTLRLPVLERAPRAVVERWLGDRRGMKRRWRNVGDTELRERRRG
jgi:hypothetical protein